MSQSQIRVRRVKNPGIESVKPKGSITSKEDLRGHNFPSEIEEAMRRGHKRIDYKLDEEDTDENNVDNEIEAEGGDERPRKRIRGPGIGEGWEKISPEK